MLLLFSVRLVRTGIERAHGASFQRLMVGQKNLAGAGTLGIVLAIVLQSSAAVALLSSGFLASGMLNFAVAMAIMLGGDFGSALVVQILSFSVEWIIAPLLAVGGWLAVKSENRRLRQYGRVVMGVALILVALGFLRETVAPVRNSSFLPFIVGYLENDILTTFIVGAVFAFVMHSSVAAILVIAALVEVLAIPFQVGVTLVVGANFGAGFIPVWLTRGMAIEARRLVYSNLFVRGSLALVALAGLAYFGGLPVATTSENAQILILSHVGFNFCLLVLALPFCRPIGRSMELMLPDRQVASASETLNGHVSALDPNVIDKPKLAITCLKQELLYMLGLVEAMFRPTFDNFVEGSPEDLHAIRAMDEDVNACLSDIRTFVASIPKSEYSKAEAREARDLVEYAIRLESAGDVVAPRLTSLAARYQESTSKFSPEGMSELVRMHENILANFKLAANVLISNDPESARLLSLEKTEVKRVERQSRKRHLKRLQNGASESLGTSDIHLESLRAMREFNGHISAIAYPILYKTGQLLETRLINELSEQVEV